MKSKQELIEILSTIKKHHRVFSASIVEDVWGFQEPLIIDGKKYVFAVFYDFSKDNLPTTEELIAEKKRLGKLDEDIDYTIPDNMLSEEYINEITDPTVERPIMLCLSGTNEECEENKIYTLKDDEDVQEFVQSFNYYNF